jgi:hypothetical protein
MAQRFSKEQFVAGLKDRFPERLGRALEDFQAGKPGLPPPWAVRV